MKIMRGCCCWYDSLGGVTLLRAAAKNHARVSIVSDPKDYNKVIQELKNGQVSQETRNTLALKVYIHISILHTMYHDT